MILNDEQRFGFIHVPKCAGTTIRMWMAQHYEVDCSARMVSLPDGSVVHHAHLTLDQLAEHYWEDFERLQSYDAIALIRDPKQRFYSAFAQHMREFRDKNVSLFTQIQLDEEMAALTEKLLAKDWKKDPELVHFLPQSDFVELNGQQIVGNLFPIERSDAAIGWISNRLGIPEPEDRELNVKKEFRVRGSGHLLHGGDRLLKRLLPKALWKSLRNGAMNGLMRQRPSTSATEAEADWPNEYLARTYVRDQHLYNRVSWKFAPPAAA